MSGIILDTNVISETMRPKPDPGVIEWLSARLCSRLFLTSVSLAELWRGVERLPDDHPRKNGYGDNILMTEKAFRGRVLDFDPQSARLWGKLVGRSERQGRVLSAMDAQIASMALRHNMALATRNTRDFQGLEIDLIDPFLIKP